MKVRDVMRREPCVCGPENDLAKVGRVMAEAGCGFLPVIGDEDRVVGVITDRDLALAVATRDRKPSEIQVRQVMSGEVYSCGPDDDVRDALKVMRERKVRRLPVMDSHHLRGILSLDDVVLEAQAVATEGFTGPFYADISRTLKEINLHQTPAVLI
jgi:CBS domain-containing protein